MRKSLQIALSVILIISTMVMFLLPAKTNADEQTGSITINSVDLLTHNPLQNSEFTIYSTADDNTTIPADGSEVTTAISDGTITQVGTITTDAAGTGTLDNLPVGRYLVVNSAVSGDAEQVSNFLVDIPTYTYDSATDKLTPTYDVSITPKTSIAYASFNVNVHELMARTSTDAALSGVTLKFEYKDGEEWKDISEKDVDAKGMRPTAETLTTDSNGVIEVTNIGAGNYRFSVTDVPTGYVKDTAPVEFNAAVNNGKMTITDKDGNEVDVMHIYVTTPEVTKASTTNANSFTIGDTISYKVTTTVPTYEIERLNTYKVVETYGAHLTMKTDSVKLLLGGETFTVDADYTVTDDAETGTLTIELTASGKAKLATDPTSTEPYADVVLTINYDATLDFQEGDTYAVANYDEDNMKNATQLVYSDVTDDTESTQTLDATKTISNVTYAQYIQKTDGTNGLAGAHFSISTSDETDTAGMPISTIEVWNGTKMTTDFVTDEDGNIQIEGLKEGTYYLFETQAPTYVENGEIKTYQRLKNPKTLTVSAATTTSSNTTRIKVVNHKSITLPATGALSATGLVVIGAIIIGLGVKVYNDNK